MTFLHLADPHLDVTTHGRYNPQTRLNSRTEDFFACFAAILDEAARRRVNAVLLAGDLFHGPRPEAVVLERFAQELRRVTDQNIPVVLIAGNHDFSKDGQPSVLQALARFEIHGLRIFTEPTATTLTGDGWACDLWAVPWLLPAHHPDPVAAVDRLFTEWRERLSDVPTIVLFHGAVEGAVYEGTEQTASAAGAKREPVFPLSLFKELPIAYVALGHIHTFQALTRWNTPPLVYPGTLDRITFGERADVKGGLFVTIAQDGVTYERWATPARTLRHLVLADDGQPPAALHAAFDAQVAELPLAGAIVKVTIQNARPRAEQVIMPGVYARLTAAGVAHVAAVTYQHGRPTLAVPEYAVAPELREQVAAYLAQQPHYAPLAADILATVAALS